MSCLVHPRVKSKKQDYPDTLPCQEVHESHDGYIKKFESANGAIQDMESVEIPFTFGGPPGQA